MNDGYTQGFMEAVDLAADLVEAVKLTLDQKYQEYPDDIAFNTKISILAALIDVISLEHGEEPGEIRKQLFEIGEYADKFCDEMMEAEEK